VSGGAGMSFASLRRCWAGGGEEELVVGASRPSQLEAVEAQDALRWANSISTFFRCRREVR
jgi:hypothetical protein